MTDFREWTGRDTPHIVSLLRVSALAASDARHLSLESYWQEAAPREEDIRPLLSAKPPGARRHRHDAL
jgi:hypothetical protein